MNSTGHIYRVYDIRDDRSYIGQTSKKNPWDRIKEHFRESHNPYLRNAINKSPNSFSSEILYGPIHSDELDHIERYMILEFNSLFPNGFNLQTGGCKNKQHSEVSKRKTRRLDLWDNKDNIIQRYQDGESAYGIANDLKCDRDLITKILREYNIPIRKHWESLINQKLRDDIDLVSQRYNNREPAYKIAKDYDTTASTVLKVLRQNGVIIRKSGGSYK